MTRFWLALLALLALAFPAGAGEGWQAVPGPETRGGVVLSPSLQTLAGRVHLFWAGTDPGRQIKEPEVYHSSVSESGGAWSDPRAPFFGDNLGKVRRVAAGVTERALAVVFQREMEQSSDAYEIRVSFSWDNGWSFRPPLVVDSYVAERAGGTAVAVAGVEGLRPGFAAAWITEGGKVRAAVLDVGSSGRPAAHDLGHHAPGIPRVALAGDGRSGFVAAWFDGRGLLTARLERLSGEAGEPERVLTGPVGPAFDVTSSRRRLYLVAESSRSLVALPWTGGGWEGAPASGTPGGALRAAADARGRVHVLRLDEASHRIDYTVLEKGRWSDPQPLFQLDPAMAVTGFDLAAGRRYLWAVAAQGPRLELRRREL